MNYWGIEVWILYYKRPKVSTNWCQPIRVDIFIGILALATRFSIFQNYRFIQVYIHWYQVCKTVLHWCNRYST